MIPYGRQSVTQEDIDAVVEVLRSDFLTQGKVVPEFESSVADYCGAKHAVAVNSATSALHLACLALDLGPGDRLWTSPVTFVASANCALYCGAEVDFVDIDPRSYNMSSEALAAKLAQAEKEGHLPKVVVPVHLCGQSCDMEAIYLLSQQYGFSIIEDASHAVGGKYKNSPVGNCAFSDITVFSFHPVKIITSGEGGMALTNNPVLCQRMNLMRSHGITNDSTLTQLKPKEEMWNYQQIELGFNYRMTDIHAALGLSQLTRIDEFIHKRHMIARKYDHALAELPLVVPHQIDASYSSYHLYVIRLELDKMGKSHQQVYQEMLLSGISVNLHYIPVYRQPYFEKMGFKVGYCPQAEKYFSEALSIPMFPDLSESNFTQIVSSLKSILS